MRCTRTLVLAALVCAATSPSFAAWQDVGSVNFSAGDNHDSAVANVHGDIIALTSRNGDVYCRSVDASFRDGTTAPIYQGKLSQGQTVNVDLEQMRDVQQLNFDCHPMDRAHARVDVAANAFPDFVGRSG